MDGSNIMQGVTKLPTQLGAIHFVGIGGIGMSGIAEALINHGFTVQGSDLKDSAITERLAAKGAKIFIGQRAANLKGAAVVVISTAIKPGNAELEAAQSFKLPIVRRAEMLAELMRLKSNIAVAGTHGKTTTTTMVAALLDHGQFDPTVINGGVIHAYDSNARVGQGEWMVVEADESDGTFNRLPATIAIVTNIDPEHMEHWGDFDALRRGFDEFVSNIPFYGLAVCCTDHPEVQALVGRLTDRRVVRSEEHTSELQSHSDLVCRLLLEKKKTKKEQNKPCMFDLTPHTTSVCVPRATTYIYTCAQSLG